MLGSLVEDDIDPPLTGGRAFWRSRNGRMPLDGGEVESEAMDESREWEGTKADDSELTRRMVRST